MVTVVLTIHVLIVLALIGIVLLQRSEGGALGMGGGGGGGGFMTGRGAASALTRTTSALAALFFITSLGLAMLAERRVTDDALIDELTGRERTPAAPTAPGAATTDDLLRSLGAEPASRPGTAQDADAAPAPAQPDGQDAPSETPPADEPPPEAPENETP